MAALNWEEYIQGMVSPEAIDRCRMSDGPALREQRDILQGLFSTYQPKRVACLGAGGLNDIPIGEFLLGGGEVYLVDWIPAVSREGFNASLIRRETDSYACMICDDRCDPARFCSGFREPVRVANTVCSGFELIEEPYPHCASYRPGHEPYFITADITLGRASEFARRAQKLVPASKTVEQSLQKGLSECRRCASVGEELDIEDDSIDLVTSSMVVSQFDHEPYAFFSRLLAERFGVDEVMRKEQRLMPQVEKLRGELFRLQIEGHAREIHRILNKERGKAYFSVELFRSLPEGGEYFLVHEIAQAMEVLNEHFHFDFSTIPPEKTLRQREFGAGTSIIQCLVLTPIAG